MYRYYCLMRPAGPGAIPQKTGLCEIHNFPERMFCEEIGREAWGYIECVREISSDVLAQYDMVSANYKKWWCVTTTFNDKGEIRSAITETREAAKKPDNWSNIIKNLDIYKEWFGSREEAEVCIKEAQSECTDCMINSGGNDEA